MWTAVSPLCTLLSGQQKLGLGFMGPGSFCPQGCLAQRLGRRPFLQAPHQGLQEEGKRLICLPSWEMGPVPELTARPSDPRMPVPSQAPLSCAVTAWGCICPPRPHGEFSYSDLENHFTSSSLWLGKKPPSPSKPACRSVHPSPSLPQPGVEERVCFGWYAWRQEDGQDGLLRPLPPPGGDQVGELRQSGRTSWRRWA